MSVLDIATAQVLMVGLCWILLSVFLPLEALRLAFWGKEVCVGGGEGGVRGDWRIEVGSLAS